MRYIYSKSENKFELSEFVVNTEEQKAIALETGYAEVTDEQYAKLKNHELCWQDGVLVPYVKTQNELAEEARNAVVRQKTERIAELQALLASWDYKTSKHADGDYTEAEWADIVAQRKAWREEINALEQELTNIQ